MDRNDSSSNNSLHEWQPNLLMRKKSQRTHIWKTSLDYVAWMLPLGKCGDWSCVIIGAPQKSNGFEFNFRKRHSERHTWRHNKRPIHHVCCISTFVTYSLTAARECLLIYIIVSYYYSSKSDQPKSHYPDHIEHIHEGALLAHCLDAALGTHYLHVCTVCIKSANLLTETGTGGGGGCVGSEAERK